MKNVIASGLEKAIPMNKKHAIDFIIYADRKGGRRTA